MYMIIKADVVAQTKGGKQILNPGKGKALACEVADGDHVAVMGTNRKMLVFPINQVPPMKRGQGVTLQKYKGAELSDLRVFNMAEGLTWRVGDRTRLEEDMKPWLGTRAGMGKLPPVGFPRSNKFK